MEQSEKDAAEFPREEDPTLTCKQGACVPGHPLHCCHLAIGVTLGIDVRAWECVDCGQMSKTKTKLHFKRNK